MLAAQHVIARPLCVVVGFDAVVFLTRHGVLREQPVVACQVGGGIVHQHFRLDYRCVGNRHVGCGGGDGAVGDASSGEGVLIVGTRPRHIQAHVGVVDNHERVSFAHLSVFLETYLLDVALHAAVDRHNLSGDLGVVGELDVAEMDELDAYPRECRGDYRYGEYI